jgi:hypothetical protein
VFVCLFFYSLFCIYSFEVLQLLARDAGNVPLNFRSKLLRSDHACAFPENPFKKRLFVLFCFLSFSARVFRSYFEVIG